MENNCNDASRWYLKNIQIINKMSNSTNKHDLGVMQYCILEIISNNEFETPAHLAEELNIASSSISRAIKKLQSRGLVDRLSSEFDDTRKIKIKITQYGKQTVLEINQELNEEFPKYFMNS